MRRTLYKSPGPMVSYYCTGCRKYFRATIAKAKPRNCPYCNSHKTREVKR